NGVAVIWIGMPITTPGVDAVTFRTDLETSGCLAGGQKTGPGMDAQFQEHLGSYHVEKQKKERNMPDPFDLSHAWRQFKHRCEKICYGRKLAIARCGCFGTGSARHPI